MRIIFVDDDPVQLYQLERMLRGNETLKLAGTYSDPRIACEELETAKPDLMITDINMPEMGGIELIKKCKAKLPELEIIALTVQDDIPTVLEAIKAGATGYLLKSVSKADMLKAIADLDGGGVPITPKLARGIIESLRAGGPDPEASLSDKETEVLRHIGQGLLYKEIADKMCVTTHAIQWHAKGIFNKLQAHCRKEAVVKARKIGLL